MVTVVSSIRELLQKPVLRLTSIYVVPTQLFKRPGLCSVFNTGCLVWTSKLLLVDCITIPLLVPQLDSTTSRSSLLVPMISQLSMSVSSPLIGLRTRLIVALESLRLSCLLYFPIKETRFSVPEVLSVISFELWCLLSSPPRANALLFVRLRQGSVNLWP